MAVIHFGSYKIGPRYLSMSAEEITITPKDHNGEYGISVRESRGAPAKNYTIYAPTEQDKVWKVVPFMDQQNPKIVRDSKMLWSVLPLEHTAKIIDLFGGGTLLTTVASVALLACKLLGWIVVGHWALYLAAASVSWVAANHFSKLQAITQFDIANRVYSVLELANADVQEINAASKLHFNPHDHVITGSNV